MGEKAWADGAIEGIVLRRIKKRYLLEDIVRQTGLSKEIILMFFSSLRDVIFEEMKKGEDFSITLPFSGSIHGKKAGGREVNMPMKNARVFSPPQYKFRFSPSDEVKEQSRLECDDDLK
jgi:nucleoid DNA-binding protein